MELLRAWHCDVRLQASRCLQVLESVGALFGFFVDTTFAKEVVASLADPVKLTPVVLSGYHMIVPNDAD